MTRFRCLGLLLAVTVVVLGGCSGEEGDADSAAASAAAPAPLAESSENSAEADANPGEIDFATLCDRILADLEGIPVEKVQEQLDPVIADYQATPTDAALVTEFVGRIASVGNFQAVQGNDQSSRVAFRAAASAINRATKDGVKLADPVLPGFVYFEFASDLATDGKPQAAAIVLAQAVDAGFTAFEQLEASEDLESVRALPEYSELLAEWEKVRLVRLQEHAEHELANGERFPFDFQLTNVVDGSPVNLADHAGKVCIVDIWGTWCPPCREEIPSFIKLQEKFGSDGFQMIGLNQEDGDTDEERAKKVADYIADNQLNYPCALINDEILSSVPDFGGFPTTIFIDKSGKVRMKAVGLHEYEFLEAVVQVLMAEDSAQDSTGD